MIDSYKRDINYLRISITDRCNLRCIYCMPKEGLSLLGHQDILSYEEILRIVKASVKTGIVKVRITGGEPLVRRGVIEFLSSLKAIKELEDISLTTNAILLEKYAEDLFNAGIKRINLSLDSLKEDKYREITRVGNLKTVIRGIEKAYLTGFSPIKINVVAIKGFNDDEIIDFANLTIDKPYHIRFIEFMPIGNAALENALGYLSNDIIMEQIARTFPIEPASHKLGKTDGPARLYQIRGALGKIGFISAISHDFCETCNRLRLTADGQLRTCLLSDSEIDLKSPLREGCTDSELASLIRYAINSKPRGAFIQSTKRQRKKCVRNMPSIGG